MNQIQSQSLSSSDSDDGVMEKKKKKKQQVKKTIVISSGALVKLNVLLSRGQKGNFKIPV